MLTGTLAMLHRALRLDARLLRTHLFRLAFAAMIYITLVQAHATSLSLGAPGLRLFESLSYLNLALITLAGVSFFATAISEEKEEETLGLLKMAGINPLGLLLGKSTSRLVGALLLLVVQFPFTLLAITLGGVTLEQVVAAYCSLAAYLILLANLGLLSSVVCRRSGNASAMTVALLLIYYLAGWEMTALQLGLRNGGVIAAGGPADNLLAALAETGQKSTIWVRMQEITSTGFAAPVVGVQVVSNVLLALAAFLASWVGFNFFTGVRPVRAGLSSRWLALGKMLPGYFRRHRPGRDALRWKEFHYVTGGWPLVFFKFFVYGVIVVGIVLIGHHYYQADITRTSPVAALAMLLCLVVEASIYSSRIFHDEWHDRTLALLMMLPIRTPHIVYSKIVGCLPALAPAFFWLVVISISWPRGSQEALNVLILPSRWFGVLLIVLLLTLTAFFSMVVRWGALPLAVGVMLFGATFGGCCFSPVLGILASITRQGQGLESAFLCVDVVVALVIAGLQFDIYRRLEITASQ